jgi:hypothetical protein
LDIKRTHRHSLDQEKCILALINVIGNAKARAIKKEEEKKNRQQQREEEKKKLKQEAFANTGLRSS